MNLKRILVFLMLTCLVVCSACSKKSAIDTNNSEVTPVEENGAVTEEDTQDDIATPSIKPTSAEEVPTGDELTLTGKESENQDSMVAYEKFMKNEAKISFNRYIPKVDMDEALYQKGTEYTLSEVLDKITSNYFQMFTNTKIEYIDYSYIDCGKDGVNELVLRFYGMDIYEPDDNSTLVYIIKYIDGKLSLCYSYETWARSDSTINYF